MAVKKIVLKRMWPVLLPSCGFLFGIIIFNDYYLRNVICFRFYHMISMY